MNFIIFVGAKILKLKSEINQILQSHYPPYGSAGDFAEILNVHHKSTF